MSRLYISWVRFLEHYTVMASIKPLYYPVCLEISDQFYLVQDLEFNTFSHVLIYCTHKDITYIVR